MNKIITLSIATSTLLLAGAYKIPEQSLNSTALAGAYVAHTTGADTAYFNPANMAFLSEEQRMEAGATLVHLPSNHFQGYQAFSATEVYPANGESQIENKVLPFLHYVAEPMGDLRWGASLTVPGGLSQRWESPYQKLFAEEFTLKVLEFNPVLSYKISDKFAVGGGARIIYSEGVVKSDGTEVGMPISRDMEGDTVQYGYNLAMSYKPDADMTLAATYRSNIDLKEEGTAKLSVAGIAQTYDADVTVPLPAALNLALSKTWLDRFTLEFNYERTYWSSYEDLDFNYNATLHHPSLVAAFDNAIAKNWNDTNTYRLGASVEVGDNMTFMTAFAIDETPIPKSKLNYELADSDARIFAMGIRIQATDNLAWGLALLHNDKEGRSLAPGESDGGIIGTFGAGGAHLFTSSISYTF